MILYCLYDIWPVFTCRNSSVPAQRIIDSLIWYRAYPCPAMRKSNHFRCMPVFSPIHIWHDLPFSERSRRNHPYIFKMSGRRGISHAKRRHGNLCQRRTFNPPASAIHSNPPFGTPGRKWIVRAKNSLYRSSMKAGKFSCFKEKPTRLSLSAIC